MSSTIISSILDAVDAYNKRLVKKIEVKGFEVKNSEDRQVFVRENIIISPKPPVAKSSWNSNTKIYQYKPYSSVWATTFMLNQRNGTV